MKRLTMIIGILLLAGAVAIPVLAWGPGMGWGNHHMMGYWGNGPGYGRDYGNLTPDQQSRLKSLDRKYNDETRALQDQIWTKSEELDTVLNSATPDIEKAKTLQKEISNLRASLDEKAFNYEIEARKIAPDQRLGYADGDWYGHHMGPYGHGMGYGYGHGYCWD
jgi:zinc resistance-associated protein